MRLDPTQSYTCRTYQRVLCVCRCVEHVSCAEQLNRSTEKTGWTRWTIRWRFKYPTGKGHFFFGGGADMWQPVVTYLRIGALRIGRLPIAKLPRRTSAFATTDDVKTCKVNPDDCNGDKCSCQRLAMQLVSTLLNFGYFLWCPSVQKTEKFAYILQTDIFMTHASASRCVGIG